MRGRIGHLEGAIIGHVFPADGRTGPELVLFRGVGAVHDAHDRPIDVRVGRGGVVGAEDLRCSPGVEIAAKLNRMERGVKIPVFDRSTTARPPRWPRR